jgi:hypothetical protein
MNASASRLNTCFQRYFSKSAQRFPPRLSHQLIGFVNATAKTFELNLSHWTEEFEIAGKLWIRRYGLKSVELRM